MTDEAIRWARVKSIFQSALERRPEERATYLDQACAADSGLRRDVDSMLRSHVNANAAGFAGQPAIENLTVAQIGSPPSLVIGQQLGHYRIEDRLGAGGMGEVYKARDTRLDRTVAIKVLRSDLGVDSDLRQRFEREARAVAALNHPHICTLYDVGPDYLVMEMIDGRPLAGPLPLARALEFATQILSALDAAHHIGITHRDLKPGNILVTKQGIKLLDFGLAKLAKTGPAISTARSVAPAAFEAPTIAQTLTGAQMILGTVHYMSPEQAQGKPVDARSDIFSFGLLLYEMLTGRRAFDGDNPASVIAAILERDVPSATDVTSPALERLLQRCLAKDPEDRWQTARDISHALAIVRDATASGKAPTSRRMLATASLAGFLTALVIAVPLLTTALRRDAERRPLSFHLTPPAETEFQFSPNGGGSAISPDGRSVAFVAVTKGTPRLWIRSLDSLVARELPDTDGARLPFWSPDSGSIGFFTSSDLRRIDIAGAEAVVLARTNDSRGGTWSPNGTIVFSPNNVGPLYQVGASGGTPAALTTLSAGESSHRWPKFLPDGRTLLYSVAGKPTEQGVYLTTLDRPLDKKLLVKSGSDATYAPGQGGNPGYLLWVARDTVVAQPFDLRTMQLTGSFIAVPGTGGVASFVSTQRASVSVSTDGTLAYSSGGARYQLKWFDRDGTPRGNVGGIEQYIGLRLSPDGREVLVTIRDTAGDGDLWRIDLANGARSRITSDGGWYAVWSPDSQQVAFTALNRRQVLQTASVRAGGKEQILSTFDGWVYPSDWTLDGKYLAYTLNSQDASEDIWLLPMTGSRTPRPLIQSPFGEKHAQFSPDGRWLAYTSNENRREEVFVRSFSDASTRRVASSAGGAYPRWGRGGKELLYRAPDGNLMTIPLRLVGSSVELGTPSVLMRLTEAASVYPYPYDVAADGRILALSPASGAVQDLTLTILMNWQTALRR
jgi:serine/threonine protein kinase